MNNPVGFVLFGILVGVFSGIMGLGGGAIMIPIMVMAFALSQPEAHGTSLAVMIPPVTLPAVIAYYRNGNVRLGMAAWMALGVITGSFFGAYIANSIPKDALKLIFGFVLIYVASYTVFGKEHMVRSVFLSLALVIVAASMYAGFKWMDARQTPAPTAAMT